MNELKSAVIDYVQQQFWAITEPMLDVIHEILHARYYGDEARRADQLDKFMAAKVLVAGGNDEKKKYHVDNGVAIIPVIGTISKRMNWFSDVSGGASTELLQRDIQSAIDDPSVNSIVLDVDSPGGTVDGVQKLQDFIYAARDKKPILSHANGLMASGAMWIGSAANKVIAAEDTTQVGSIGVITAHYDYSKYYEDKGLKKTYLYSGRYKAAGADNAPLNKEDKEYIQSRLDGIYTIMVDSIARNLGTSSDKVLSDMADAKMFLAKDAVKAGLIHDIATLEDTVVMAREMGTVRQLAAGVSALNGRLDSLLGKYK